MADLTDVETAIANIVSAAIYPNGTGQPSILPNAASARIARGWPLPATLDADLAAGNAQITVYPLGGSATPTYQIQDQTYTISPAAINLAVTITGPAVTVSGGGTVVNVSGQPATGEYLTLVCDKSHVYSRSGSTAAAIISALLTDVQADYPAATATSSSITVPVNAYLEVRQGGVATLGKVIHRQRHAIMVSVWAPNDAVRTAAASAADIALKENIKIAMPDTSQCILRYLRTMSSDQQEKAMIYRRDLIYDVEFATVQQFPGYVITSTKTSISDPNNAAIANAIT